MTVIKGLRIKKQTKDSKSDITSGSDLGRTKTNVYATNQEQVSNLIVGLLRSEHYKKTRRVPVGKVSRVVTTS